MKFWAYFAFKFMQGLLEGCLTIAALLALAHKLAGEPIWPLICLR